MSITKLPPNTIWLAGPYTEIADLEASVAICPGMLVETYTSGGKNRLRPHATAGVATARQLAVEASYINKGVNDGYAVGDMVKAVAGAGGTEFWALIPSGQNIAFGDKLQSAGDGTLVILASGVALFSARESVDNTNGDKGPTNPPPQTGGTTALPVGAARIRVEVV